MRKAHFWDQISCSQNRPGAAVIDVFGEKNPQCKLTRSAVAATDLPSPSNLWLLMTLVQKMFFVGLKHFFEPQLTGAGRRKQPPPPPCIHPAYSMRENNYSKKSAPPPPPYAQGNLPSIILMPPRPADGTARKKIKSK